MPKALLLDPENSELLCLSVCVVSAVASLGVYGFGSACFGPVAKHKGNVTVCG